MQGLGLCITLETLWVYNFGFITVVLCLIIFFKLSISTSAKCRIRRSDRVDTWQRCWPVGVIRLKRSDPVEASLHLSRLGWLDIGASQHPTKPLPPPPHPPLTIPSPPIPIYRPRPPRSTQPLHSPIPPISALAPPPPPPLAPRT